MRSRLSLGQSIKVFFFVLTLYTIIILLKFCYLAMYFNQSSKAYLASLLTTTTSAEKSASRKGNDSLERHGTSNRHPTSSKLLRKQMTSIGRFSLSSQTEENPSIISFFVALAHEEGKDLNLEAFNSLWSERIMSKYERFRFHVCREDNRYFEVRLYSFLCSSFFVRSMLLC